MPSNIAKIIPQQAPADAVAGSGAIKDKGLAFGNVMVKEVDKLAKAQTLQRRVSLASQLGDVSDSKEAALRPRKTTFNSLQQIVKHALELADGLPGVSFTLRDPDLGPVKIKVDSRKDLIQVKLKESLRPSIEPVVAKGLLGSGILKNEAKLDFEFEEVPHVEEKDDPVMPAEATKMIGKWLDLNLASLSRTAEPPSRLEINVTNVGPVSFALEETPNKIELRVDTSSRAGARELKAILADNGLIRLKDGMLELTEKPSRSLSAESVGTQKEEKASSGKMAELPSSQLSGKESLRLETRSLSKQAIAKPIEIVFTQGSAHKGTVSADLPRHELSKPDLMPKELRGMLSSQLKSADEKTVSAPLLEKMSGNVVPLSERSLRAQVLGKTGVEPQVVNQRHNQTHNQTLNPTPLNQTAQVQMVSELADGLVVSGDHRLMTKGIVTSARTNEPAKTSTSNRVESVKLEQDDSPEAEISAAQSRKQGDMEQSGQQLRDEQNPGKSFDGVITQANREVLSRLSVRDIAGMNSFTLNNVQYVLNGDKLVALNRVDASQLPEMVQKIADLANSQHSLAQPKLEVQFDINEMGRFLVDAMKHKDKINLHINVDTPEVKRLLENQVRTIVEQISRDGIEIGRLEVSVRDHQSREQAATERHLNSDRRPADFKQGDSQQSWQQQEEAQMQRSFGYNSLEVLA